jgi:hypothetical protein
MKNSNLIYKSSEKFNINKNTEVIPKNINYDITNINNNIDNIEFKRYLYNKTSNLKYKNVLKLFMYKYIGINKRKKLIIDMLDLKKNIFSQNQYDKNNIEKKNINLRKSKLLKYKKYFENLK